MKTNQERQRELTAFRRMRDKLARNYPRGRFLAICEGSIVADAEKMDALRSNLIALGKNPSEALVVRAGDEYPEEATIC